MFGVAGANRETKAVGAKQRLAEMKHGLMIRKNGKFLAEKENCSYFCAVNAAEESEDSEDNKNNKNNEDTENNKNNEPFGGYEADII